MVVYRSIAWIGSSKTLLKGSRFRLEQFFGHQGPPITVYLRKRVHHEVFDAVPQGFPLLHQRLDPILQLVGHLSLRSEHNRLEYQEAVAAIQPQGFQYAHAKHGPSPV